MKKCTVTVTDEVYCTLSGLRPPDLEFLVNKFALMVEGARWMPKFKLGVWDGKVKFLTPNGKIFHRLLDEVLPYLENWNYEIELIDKRTPVKLPEVRITEEWFLNKPNAAPNILLRDYQVDAVNLSLATGGGILLMCTGAGKTFTVAALCDALGQSDIKCLVIVPSVDLVEQTALTFKLCGLDVGMYSGKIKDVNHQHVISTWQSLQNQPQLVKDYSSVIVDECIHPDTLVETISGFTKIKNINVGDLVKTINEKTHTYEFKPVIKVHHNLSIMEKKFKLTTGNGKFLIITGNHKILTCTGWKRTDKLSLSDNLLTVSSDKLLTGKIKSIEEIDYSGEVFNLHIQDNHNYFASGVIVSNCHGAKASVIGELLNNAGINIPFRYGCTGTIPKPVIEKTTIKGTLGDVIYEISANELMNKGYLAQVEIEPIELQESVLEEFPDYSSEKAYLAGSASRLECLADLIITKGEQYGNTLVLVNSIKQGKALHALISDSIFLHGATENTVRAEWYSTFEDKENLIVIATYGIASTGISINRIFCLAMIDSGKSFTRSIQSVGRTLRLGRDKNTAQVIDIYSNLKWSKKHARERAKYYKEATYPMLKVKKLKIN